MGKYRLVFKKSVARDLQDILKKDVVRILKCFDKLADDPRAPGCEKLSDQERYRIRQGVYRIVYETRDDELEVTVVRVGHRKQAYKNL